MLTANRLTKSNIFEGLNDAEINEILPFCEDRGFDTGSTLYSFGDPAEEFFVLLDGSVEVRISTDYNYGITSLRIKHGNAFGFSALLEKDNKYRTQAVCLEDVKAVGIQLKPFIDYISNKNTKTGFVIMRNLAKIFMSRNEFIEELYKL